MAISLSTTGDGFDRWKRRLYLSITSMSSGLARNIALAKKERTAFISKPRCQVQTMSAEVISLPAQLLIPGRRWNVQVLKSSLPSHLSTQRPITPSLPGAAISAA
jgi:hypothetical protein